VKFRIYEHNKFWNEDFPKEIREFEDEFAAYEYCQSLYRSGGSGYWAKPLDQEIKEKLSKESSLRKELEEIEQLKKEKNV
jgi:hypothetical protein